MKPSLKTALKLFLLPLFLCITGFTAFAQVPTNDNPCNGTTISAISLTPAAVCTYSTFTNAEASATTDAGIPLPTCGNFTDADVWFKVTVPTGATAITVDTKGVTMQDGAMAIYSASGTCPNLTLTQLACDDASSANLDFPKITVSSPAGTTLYVRFWGFGGEQGTFGICVTASIPPTNDDCLNATPLTVNPDYLCGVTTAGTTVNATQSTNTPNPTCGNAAGFNDDVWYSFVATSPGHRIVLSNITGTSTNMTMQVYSGTCGALTAVACINGNTLNLTGLTPTATYYIRVYTNPATTVTASFNICVGTAPPPPANDNCANATPLTVNPTLTCTAVTAGGTESATQSTETPAPSCGTVNGWNDDVWYTFVAGATTHRITLSSVLPAATVMNIVAYSGTCGAFTGIVGCSTGTNVLNLTGLTPNATYYVRVFTNVTAVATTATFNICVASFPAPPANDECAGAVALTVNNDQQCGVVTAGTTISATQSVGVPNPTCGAANGYNDDVWFSFVATGPLHRVTLSNITGDATNLTMQVYSGTCGALTTVACINGNVLNLTGLTSTNTYYVRVFTNVATAQTFASFNICIGTPPPPPANDEPCTAATLIPGNTCVFQTYTTENATATPGVPAPGCAQYNGGDVWFKITVPAGGAVTINSQAGVLTDGGMATYSGTFCTALTLITCSDDVNGLMPEIFANGLIPGSTLWVRFWAYNNGTPGTFGICASIPPPPPANDNCSGAITLPVNNDATCALTTNGNTASATPSTGVPTPSCGTANGFNDDVWFKFVATNVNQQISLSNVVGATGMDIVVYTGTCGALTQFQCTNGLISTLNGLTVNATYYVRVYTDVTTPTTSASFTICVGTVPPPGPGTVCAASNPFCSTSQPSQNSPVGNPGYGGGGVYGCLGSTPNPTWYVLQVATAGNLIINIHQQNAAGNGIDVDFAAWGPFTSVSAGCAQIAAGGITPISCSYSINADETATINNAQVGQFYILLVTNYNGQAGTITFNTSGTGTTNCGIVCNATASNSGPACPGGTFNLTGNSTTSGATYAWTGPAGYTSNVQSPQNVVAPAIAGSYVYTLTVTTPANNTCTATTTVVVSQPAAPTAPSPITYCQNATAVPLTATGTNLMYYTTATGGTGSTTAPTPSTATVGTTTYYVSQTFAPCESPRTAIIVNVNPTPAAPTVTTPVDYCQGAIAVPISATGTGLLYYTTATGGTGSSTAPTPSTTTAGTTNYYVSQTTGTCEGPRTQIVVNVNPTPSAPAVTSPVTYCQGDTPAPVASACVGCLYYTTATGGTGSSTAPTPSTATIGTTVYYVSSTTGTCEGPRASITVNVNAAPAAPTVTSPVNYCQGAVAGPLTATGTGLLYYTTATGGTGSSTAPTPSTATVGTTSYYVSQSTGCESPRAQIDVIVSATPAAPAVTTPVTYCQGQTAAPLTATGTNILYYTTATGGTGSATAPTPSTATVGSTTYYVSQTTGTCEGPRAAITVTVSATPAAPTVTTPVNYCQGATSAPISATGIGLLYYTTATGGTGSSTAPTPSTTTTGTSTYYVSSSNGSCEGPRAAIVVNVNPTPAAPIVTTPVTYCQGGAAVPLTAIGTNLMWYTTATGGTGTTTAPTPSTANNGSTTYYVSSTSGTCEGPRAAITVTVSALPAPPNVTTPVTYCQNSTATALEATGTNLLYYTTATGGTGTSTAPIPSTATAGTTTYYVSQNTGSCEGPRTAIVVNITPALFANAGSPVSITLGQSTQLNGSGTPGANYLWTANGPLALSSATILNPVANPVQTTVYTLTVSNPAAPTLCPASSSVVVTVITNPAKCINVRNAFSPNGDGMNDYWMVYDQTSCLRPNGVTVNVFNRYGNKVFESKNYTNTWDGTYKGKPAPDGTYYAVVDFTLENGTHQTIRTDVTILR